MTRSEEAGAIVHACLARGVMINCTAGNVLRFIPPLIFTNSAVYAVFYALNDSILDICDRGGLRLKSACT